MKNYKIKKLFKIKPEFLIIYGFPRNDTPVLQYYSVSFVYTKIRPCQLDRRRFQSIHNELRSVIRMLKDNAR